MFSLYKDFEELFKLDFIEFIVDYMLDTVFLVSYI